jgi:large repetitive protein
MRPLVIATLLLALSACRTDPEKLDTDTLPPDDTGPDIVDADGDGYGTDEDCDDGDAAVHPGAEEVCDGVDNDCDDQVDEDVVGTFFADADADGYGDAASSLSACTPPDGYVEDATDCDDTNPDTWPGAPERCDGEDNDCDDEIDEDLNELWYADADGDTYGNASNTYEGCDPGTGWVLDASDCDDSNSTVNPGADEVCNDTDDDCDGDIDEDLESTWYGDADGDGFGDPATELFDCERGAGWVEDSTDCDDANSDIHPDATEICDSLDNDCDGLIDDADDSVTGTTTWYTDSDGDGYGDDAGTTAACDQPSGTSAYGGDCDDTDAAYNPGAAEDDCTDPADYNCDGSTGYADDDGDGFAACEDCDDSDAAVNPSASEACNGVDDDCDGDIDEDDAIDTDTWYADADGDGFGDLASTTTSCDQPSGYVSAAYATDCDDGDASISPVDPEVCDGLDNDCDGSIDEGLLGLYYADLDSDGYGDASSSTEACAAPSGYVVDDSDCDDGEAAVNPGASEICDGLDNDCDGLVDDDDSAVGGTTTWYVDYDGDGYGGGLLSTTACAQPSNYVADSSDCDDSDASAYPGAEELCDGVDNDCDGTVDGAGATDVTTWYADSDGDGYGDVGMSQDACTQPSGYVADAGPGLEDCDDADAAVNPAATELCNGVDDDCDGSTDEDDAADAGTWYLDGDGDGYGDAGSSTAACSAPSGYVADSSDCDDADAAVNPAASELCDGADNDCDGTVDEDDASDASTWYADADADGYGDAGTTTVACDMPSGFTTDSSDCDDANNTVYPGAVELCDGLDNNCDTGIDEGAESTWYADADADGFGDASVTVESCTAPSGYVGDSADCDDSDGAVHPGASEVCDGVDNDCDGAVDGPGSADASTWYIDADSDGHGSTTYSTDACTQPSGYVADTTDCDDWDAQTYPGADETCDGADNDCDGSIDEEALDYATWYLDADGDGYGDPATSVDACEAPTGYTDDASDCDDSDGTINPDADEVCDGVDNDCDGSADSGTVDTDGDGLCNDIDPDVYSYDFDDSAWTGWTYVDLGGGNVPYWYMSGGYLYEKSNAALTIAYGPDLGPMDSYSITVDVYNGGAANNQAGIVFAMVDSDDYWLARWNDPTDYYGSYSPPGQLALYECLGGTCSELATDDGTVDLSVSYSVWSVLGLTVDGDDVSISLDGVEYVSYAATGEAPLGADIVGLYSFDNDGGMYYDDFEVTNP